MSKRPPNPAELKGIGARLLAARKLQGVTQQELAMRTRIVQPRLSRIEKGDVLPTLPQLLRLGQALALPLQWFLHDGVLPGTELANIALQLRWLGVEDLFIPEATVPGAFLPTEQVLALTVRGKQPEPRIIESVPALLAWNRWSPTLLRAYSRPRGGPTHIRLAWLADVALTIHRTTGFPGGCPEQRHLEVFVARSSRTKRSLQRDDLGHPGHAATLPPVSKRWKISYAAPLSAFLERAQVLASLRASHRSSLPVKTDNE